MYQKGINIFLQNALKELTYLKIIPNFQLLTLKHENYKLFGRLFIRTQCY